LPEQTAARRPPIGFAKTIHVPLGLPSKLRRQTLRTSFDNAAADAGLLLFNGQLDFSTFADAQTSDQTSPHDRSSSVGLSLFSGGISPARRYVINVTLTLSKLCDETNLIPLINAV